MLTHCRFAAVKLSGHRVARRHVHCPWDAASPFVPGDISEGIKSSK